MAGNPIQKLLPYVKKYGAEIWMASGFILFVHMRYQDNKIYKWVYGENDYQRRNHLEGIRDYINQHEDRQAVAANVSH